METFFDRISMLLAIKNLTQKEMVEKTGISSEAVFSNWKRRDSMPSAEIVVKIAKYLNTTVEYLVEGSSETVQNVSQVHEPREKDFEISEKIEYPGMNGAAMVGRIDSALQQRNLKRVDMCLQLGIATSIMSTWKARNSFPAADTAVRIADFLGVSFRWLVTGDNGCNFDSSENDLEFKKKYENLKSAIKKTISEY